MLLTFWKRLHFKYLLSEPSYIAHYLLYVFPVVLFIVLGGWFKVSLLLTV